MKKILKRGAILITGVFISISALTGCSDSKQETTAAAVDGSNGTTDGTVPADVKKIVDAGVLKVGAKIDVPKFGLQNTATSQYEGFEIDLAYEIAGKIFNCSAAEAKTNKLVSFQGVTAKTRGPLLDNGELDLVIATYTITPERKETWNFSTPYYTDAVGLMVLKSSGITSIEDLDKKVIGVSQGSVTQDGFKKYVADKGLNVNPDFEEFDGYPALATALAAQNIDVFSVDRAILAGYNDDTTMILDDRFAEQEYGVASKKENSGLASLVDDVVTELLDSGEMANMMTEWGIE